MWRRYRFDLQVGQRLGLPILSAAQSKLNKPRGDGGWLLPSNQPGEENNRKAEMCVAKEKDEDQGLT